MASCTTCPNVQQIIDLQAKVTQRRDSLRMTIQSLQKELADLRQKNLANMTPDTSICPVTTNPEAYFYPSTANPQSSENGTMTMPEYDLRNWIAGGVQYNSGVLEKPCKCNSGIPRSPVSMAPQAVGDATIPVNPGSITGAVPINRPIPRAVQMLPQAIQPFDADTIRSQMRYVPGPITGAVPIDERTLIDYYVTV